MPLSGFNLYVEGYPESGQTLVHNTFSGAYVVLEAAQLAALRRADRGEPLAAAERALADDPELADPDVGVVVASRADEEAEYRAWFERRRARDDTLEVIVGVNRACNFACTYCAQDDVLDGTVMTESTADATADWVVTRARQIGAPAVRLVFIGGEPLLHPGRVERIARRVRRGFPDGEVRLSLVTNGYFLTPERVARLVPLGLDLAKVTLDGDATTHARTRVSKRGEDTFARVFGNVIAASRHLRILLNGNYQDDTIHGFAPLLRQLRAAGLPAGTEVSFSPALATLGAGADTGTGSCSWSGADDYQVALADEVLRHGFSPRELHAVGPCAFHDHHSLSIDPEGTLHQCPAFMGHPEWAVGDVRGGLAPRYRQMLGVNPQRECAGCAHRPNCSGGCIAAEWLRVGRMEGVTCERGYLDRVVPEALPREYLRATRESADALADFPAAGRALPPQAVRPAAEPSVALPPGSRGRRSAALTIVAA